MFSLLFAGLYHVDEVLGDSDYRHGGLTDILVIYSSNPGMCLKDYTFAWCFYVIVYRKQFLVGIVKDKFIGQVFPSSVLQTSLSTTANNRIFGTVDISIK